MIVFGLKVLCACVVLVAADTSDQPMSTAPPATTTNELIQSTTTQTTSTATTTTTTTTTTTMAPHVNITVSYSKSNGTIMFTWETSWNWTTDSTWFTCQDLNGVTLSNTTNVLYLDSDSPGSVYNCFAKIDQTESNMASVKIDLAPVANFTVTSPTPNTIILNFKKPNGLYDYLQLTCSANDSASYNYPPSSLTFTQNISYTTANLQSAKYTVSQVIGGLYYSCHITTRMIGFDDKLSLANVTVLLSKFVALTIFFLKQHLTDFEPISAKSNSTNELLRPNQKYHRLSAGFANRPELLRKTYFIRQWPSSFFISKYQPVDSCLFAQLGPQR
jgi:hypothetical protein